MSAWLAAHVSWLVCALLALWAPPLLFTLGVGLGLITGVPSGFLDVTDPAVVTSAIQLGLMAAALPGLRRRQPVAWRLLAGALTAWAAHNAWAVQGRIRLTGVVSLGSPETLLALGGMTIAAAILYGVRAHFRERRCPDRRVAPGSPAHVP